MPKAALVQLSLEAYLIFFGLLAVIIGVMYWLLQRGQRQARDQFFQQFESSELRMSPYRIGLVYRIVGTENEEIAVIPIWDGKSRVANGKERRVTLDELIPFDSSRFF